MKLQKIKWPKRVIAAALSLSLVIPSPAYAARSVGVNASGVIGSQKTRAELRAALEKLGMNVETKFAAHRAELRIAPLSTAKPLAEQRFQHRNWRGWDRLVLQSLEAQSGWVERDLALEEGATQEALVSLFDYLKWTDHSFNRNGIELVTEIHKFKGAVAGLPIYDDYTGFAVFYRAANGQKLYRIVHFKYPKEQADGEVFRDYIQSSQSGVRIDSGGERIQHHNATQYEFDGNITVFNTAFSGGGSAGHSSMSFYSIGSVSVLFLRSELRLTHDELSTFKAYPERFVDNEGLKLLVPLKSLSQAAEPRTFGSVTLPVQVDRKQIRTQEEMLKFVAQYLPEVYGMQRFIDVGGSSIDLRALIKLTTAMGINALDFLPSTTIVAGDFPLALKVGQVSQDLQLSASEVIPAKDIIQYVIDYKKWEDGKIQDKQRVYTVVRKNGAMYTLMENNSLRPFLAEKDGTYEIWGEKGAARNQKRKAGQVIDGQMGSFAYFMGQIGAFGLQGDFRTLQPVAEAGGLGRSGGSNAMFLAMASAISGANLTKADMQAESVEVEGNGEDDKLAILGGYTGGQESGATLLGGASQMIHLTEVKDTVGNYVWPVGTELVVPLAKTLEEVNERMLSHVALVQAGLPFENGSATIKRTAGGINTTWCERAKHPEDTEGIRLHKSKILVAMVAAYGVAHDRWDLVVWSQNEHRRIRNELDKGFYDAALQALEGKKDRPVYADKYLQILRDDPILNKYLQWHIQGHDDHGKPFDLRKVSLYSLTSEPLIEEVTRLVREYTGKPNLQLTDLDSPAGVFIPGAGGTGSPAVILVQMNDLMEYILKNARLDDGTGKRVPLSAFQAENVMQIMGGNGMLQGYLQPKAGKALELKNLPDDLAAIREGYAGIFDQETGTFYLTEDPQHVPAEILELPRVKMLSAHPDIQAAYQTQVQGRVTRSEARTAAASEAKQVKTTVLFLGTREDALEWIEAFDPAHAKLQGIKTGIEREFERLQSVQIHSITRGDQIDFNWMDRIIGTGSQTLDLEKRKPVFTGTRAKAIAWIQKEIEVAAKEGQRRRERQVRDSWPELTGQEMVMSSPVPQGVRLFYFGLSTILEQIQTLPDQLTVTIYQTPEKNEATNLQYTFKAFTRSEAGEGSANEELQALAERLQAAGFIGEYEPGNNKSLTFVAEQIRDGNNIGLSQPLVGALGERNLFPARENVREETSNFMVRIAAMMLRSEVRNLPVANLLTDWDAIQARIGTIVAEREQSIDSLHAQHDHDINELHSRLPGDGNETKRQKDIRMLREQLKVKIKQIEDNARRRIEVLREEQQRLQNRSASSTRHRAGYSRGGTLESPVRSEVRQGQEVSAEDFASLVRSGDITQFAKIDIRKADGTSIKGASFHSLGTDNRIFYYSSDSMPEANPDSLIPSAIAYITIRSEVRGFEKSETSNQLPVTRVQSHRDSATTTGTQVYSLTSEPFILPQVETSRALQAWSVTGSSDPNSGAVILQINAKQLDETAQLLTLTGSTAPGAVKVVIAHEAELKRAIARLPLPVGHFLIAEDAGEALTLARSEIKRLQDTGIFSSRAEVRALVLDALSSDAVALKRQNIDVVSITPGMTERMMRFAGIADDIANRVRAELRAGMSA